MMTFDEFWDECFGEQFGKHESPLEPFYSIAGACWDKAEEIGFQRQNAVCDKYSVEIDALNKELMKWKGRRCC